MKTKSKTKNSFEFLKFLSVVKNRENVFNLFHGLVKSFSLLILMLFHHIYNTDRNAHRFKRHSLNDNGP
ncbi:MAG: hypothetical protein CVT88_05560 [Candidatus Altiarchaeales archaeon HGW-Altiarchaeales-1]|nr:MAG: hypothetical protein CVT88_05560 [Candidatus Altiarchaeales archaeon HGW-Altiarchaeales-1]